MTGSGEKSRSRRGAELSYKNGHGLLNTISLILRWLSARILISFTVSFGYILTAVQRESGDPKMGLADLVKPTAKDADVICETFILQRAGTVLPERLSFRNAPRAVDRRERVVRIAQYYLWLSLNRDLSPSAKRKRAMWKVEQEFEDVDRTKLLNAVYDLYEDRAEGENALDQFEADLERLSVVYERHDEAS